MPVTHRPPTTGQRWDHGRGIRKDGHAKSATERLHEATQKAAGETISHATVTFRRRDGKILPGAVSFASPCSGSTGARRDTLLHRARPGASRPVTAWGQPGAMPTPSPACEPACCPRPSLRILPSILTLALALALLPASCQPLPAAARAPSSGPTAQLTEGMTLYSPRPGRLHYQWPTGSAARILEAFDPPAVRWGSGHRGVDLAAIAGQEIRAAGAGTVAFAGMVAGRPVISLDHADGIRTTYEPVQPAVAAGEHVAAGGLIGYLLAGHRSEGADALHWGARTSRHVYVNPLRLITPAVIRLKPL